MSVNESQFATTVNHGVHKNSTSVQIADTKNKAAKAWIVGIISTSGGTSIFRS